MLGKTSQPLSFELSVPVEVTLGLIVGLDLMLVGGPGIGIGPRLGFGWRF